MTARLEAYLYGTSEASMADAVGITVTEPGPVVYTARLLTPAILTDALTAWQAALNASALAGTYTLAWSTANQSVTISATGVASFDVEFGGNIAAALGFSSSTGHTGALTYSGDQQALARFDGIKVSTHGVLPHDAVELHEYRHGRHRAIAWSKTDVLDATVHAERTAMDVLLRSYCSAGLVRLYMDEAVLTAYAIANVAGYIDGAVIALGDVEHRPARGYSRARLLMTRGQ